MAQLPQTEGGFRDIAKVYPQAIAEKQVTAENGEVWVFSGWDQDEVTINKGNVLYTGSGPGRSSALSLSRWTAAAVEHRWAEQALHFMNAD